MHQSSRKRDMNIENVPAANIQRPTGRVTRARAKVLGASGGLPPLHPVVKQDHKRALQPKTKRTSLYDKSVTVVTPIVQAKRRAVLKDITNNSFDESSIKAPSGNKVQISKRVKRCAVKKNERAAQSSMVNPQIQKKRSIAAESITKQSINELCEANSQIKSENDKAIQLHVYKNPSIGSLLDLNLDNRRISNIHSGLGSSSQQGEHTITNEVEASHDESIIDIDSKHTGPQMCSLYAAEVYANLRTAELKWRHSIDYMKTLQLEITQQMRGILIDWLVEVLDMEHQILDVLSFQLSVPTIKKFLRRFLLAAQSSYKAPVIELEFLANYLAELTQTVYSFIKFLPSLVAASSIYLAKWTLHQDEDPWNATLEYYTNYKAPELKVTVLALQDLQLNNASPLHAIRQKYKQTEGK